MTRVDFGYLFDAVSPLCRMVRIVAPYSYVRLIEEGKLLSNLNTSSQSLHGIVLWEGAAVISSSSSAMFLFAAGNTQA